MKQKSFFLHKRESSFVRRREKGKRGKKSEEKPLCATQHGLEGKKGPRRHTQDQTKEKKKKGAKGHISKRRKKEGSAKKGPASMLSHGK